MLKLDKALIDRAKLDEMGKKFQSSEFGDLETKRSTIEIKWMQYLRQFKAKYDPNVVFEANTSRIHPGFTRGMIMSLFAKLTNITPENERDWALKPTPVPKVGPEALASIIADLSQPNASGQRVAPTPKQIREALRKYTAERCEAMSELIDDQLLEDGYREKDRQAKFSSLLYGTGFVKGPMSENFATNEVRQDPTTKQWAFTDTTSVRPSSDYLPHWRVYLDMTTTEPEKCNYIYELHALTAHEMRDLAEHQPDFFFGDVILSILNTKPTGNYRLRTWEADVQAESDSQQVSLNTNNYEVVERNGFISSKDLYEAGIIEDDTANEDMLCSVWLCDNRVIGIWQWPPFIKLLTDLYHIYYYIKDETSIYGTGLAEVIRDAHLGIAACNRHKLDNAAWIAGPCGEVNANSSMLAAGQAKTLGEFRPKKFVIKNAAPQFANYKILEFYEIAPRIRELAELEQQLEMQAYKSASLPFNMSNIPAKDIGLKEAAQQFQNFTDFIKEIVKHFDCAKGSLIDGYYQWNMLYTKNPDVKGDMSVENIGTYNLIMKEAAIEQIAFLMQSDPDFTKRYVKGSKFYLQLLKPYMPNPYEFIRSEDEVAQSDQLAQQKQQEIESLQRQLALVEAQLTMEKTKNVAVRSENLAAKTQQILAETPHVTTAAELQNVKTAAEIDRAHADTAARHVETAQSLVGATPGPAEGA